jgi:hypothetical protein
MVHFHDDNESSGSIINGKFLSLIFINFYKGVGDT